MECIYQPCCSTHMFLQKEPVLRYRMFRQMHKKAGGGLGGTMDGGIAMNFANAGLSVLMKISDDLEKD